MKERYINWSEIGQGATATVYKVYDKELEMDVAIKLLKEKHLNNSRLLEGMRHEIRISRELRHSNICPIHDFYEGERGVGIVMDCISGIELRDWMDEHEGDLLASVDDRLQLLIIISATLEIAHKHIVHRDLKPANIFLLDGKIDKPVIMDFGISIVGKQDSNEIISGTPKYMAPEQYSNPTKVDQRSDLFAVGVMAYELFTNKIPPVSLRNILKTRKPPKVPLTEIPLPSQYCPAIPASLDQVILQLLAYEQQDRPQSAAEVSKILESTELLNVDLTNLGSNKVTVDKIAVVAGEVYVGKKPKRKVTITPFSMDKTPVTNRAYKIFVESSGYTVPPFLDDPLFGKDEHPVVGISWDDAIAYADWAGGELPTEAEWECAAKGGVRFVEYPWGNDIPAPTQANIDNINQATTVVAAFPAGNNSYGLADMCGNVWEWCKDSWDEKFFNNLNNGTIDPISENNSSERVLRGGAFDSLASMGSCSFRFHAPQNVRRNSIGFRLIYKD